MIHNFILRDRDYNGKPDCIIVTEKSKSVIEKSIAKTKATPGYTFETLLSNLPKGCSVIDINDNNTVWW